MGKQNLNHLTCVRFVDYTDYDADLSRDGGRYGFWTDYKRVGSEWEIQYGTTSDMDYCPCCGTFRDHYEGDECIYESGYSCGDFGTVTDEELLERINQYDNTDVKYVCYPNDPDAGDIGGQSVSEQKAHAIVDLFEELLDAKGIEIPCADETEQNDRHDGGNCAKLYGMEYYNLVEAIQGIIG